VKRMVLILVVTVTMLSCPKRKEATVDASWPLLHLQVFAELNSPNDLYDSLSACRGGCKGSRATCERVERKWLCLVRCDRDDQCPAKKQCFCHDHEKCSVHISDLFDDENPRVCVSEWEVNECSEFEEAIRKDTEEQEKELQRRQKAGSD
jgi:hypothetical protein